MSTVGIERFRGYALPGGTFTVEPDKHALFLEAVDAEPSPLGHAHPMFSFIAAHNGMGLTFPKFMELLEPRSMRERCSARKT